MPDAARNFSAMPERKGPRAWVSSALGGLVDQVIQHWAALVSIGGGAVMGYLASISAWLAPYGPVAWGGVAVVSLVVISLAALGWSKATEIRALARYANARALAGGANALAPTHDHERIVLSDFYHPFYKPVETVRFEHCDLMGPANVFMDGCTLTDSGLHDCEAIIVAKGTAVRGAVGFKHCTFARCHIFRATLLMFPEQYVALQSALHASIPIISGSLAPNGAPSVPGVPQPPPSSTPDS